MIIDFDPYSDIFIGIDLGQKTCGIVKGNQELIYPVKNVTHEPNDWTCLMLYIRALVLKTKIKVIVIGYPGNLKTLQAPRTFIQLYIIKFFQQLKQEINVPILLVDERETTILAKFYLQGPEQFLFQQNVDLYAAKLILERFLSQLIHIRKAYNKLK